MAPEVLRDEASNEKLDVYSFEVDGESSSDIAGINKLTMDSSWKRKTWLNNGIPWVWQLKLPLICKIAEKRMQGTILLTKQLGYYKEYQKKLAGIAGQSNATSIVTCHNKNELKEAQENLKHAFIEFYEKLRSRNWMRKVGVWRFNVANSLAKDTILRWRIRLKIFIRCCLEM
ncbi:hypothetical protein Tco_0169971 [Tanacetum coccineum]